MNPCASHVRGAGAHAAGGRRVDVKIGLGKVTVFFFVIIANNGQIQIVGKETGDRKSTPGKMTAVLKRAEKNY